MTPELIQTLAGQPVIVIVIVIAYWLIERGHKRELEAARAALEREKTHNEALRSLMATVLASHDANTKALTELQTTLEGLAADLRRRPAQPRAGGESP
jgi:type II secretory pathway component PulM